MDTCKKSIFWTYPSQVETALKRLSSHLVSIFYRCQVVESFLKALVVIEVDALLDGLSHCFLPPYYRVTDTDTRF